jgi:carbon monoxide dehydrogenase subunit G
MKLEQSFDVNAPIDVVWRALNDLERVAPCLPGASITGHDDDGTYHGEFKVKLGPTTAAYRGTIRITESDEAAHRATLAARGADKRGQGGANATIVNTLEEADGVTRVNAVTDFSITGRLARFGRGGMIEDISNKLLQNFATCLATRLAEAPSGDDVAAGAAAPEAAAPPVTAPAETTGAEVAAGDAAPEEIAAPSAAPAQAAGAEVATGAAAPEAAAGGGSWDATPDPADAVAASRAAATPGPAPSQGGPAQPPASEPLKVGGLFWSALWERIKRLLGGGRKT